MNSKIVLAVASALVLAAGGVQAADAAKAQELLKSEGCVKCHDMDKKKTGPAIKDIVANAKKEGLTADKVVAAIKANPKHKKKVDASDDDLKTIADWLLTL
jgi:cytochrome c